MKHFLKIAPYLILLVGFALRLYRLGANSLWYDETVSLYLAQSDLAELIRHTAGDIHPPLYYIVLHFWGRIAGWSEFAMAFVSLWFGVLLIALAYRITRQWLAQNIIAIVAALFDAISPYNIWYSQEVRMYTLGAVLGLLSVYFLRNMLAQKKFFTRDFFAYVIFTVLGFYTLYYFIFLMVFQYAYVAYRAWRIANVKSLLVSRFSFLSTFALSQIALALLYLPWLPIAFRQATDPPVPPWREFIALPRVILETFSALAFGQAMEWNVFGFVSLLLFIPIAALLWREWKSSRSTVLANSSYAKRNRSTLLASRSTVSSIFLLGYFLIPLASIYLFSLWKPLYHVRYMFTYSPAFYILAAYALVNLANEFQTAQRAVNTRWLYALGVSAMLVSIGFFIITGFSLYNFWHNPQYAEDDLRGAVNYIAERWRPGDVILVNAGYAYPALVYYFPQPLQRERLTDEPMNRRADEPTLLQTGSIDGAKTLGWGDPRSDFYATTADETRAALDRVFENYSRVWMLRIYDTVVDPNGIVRAYFNEHATRLDDQAFGGESQTRVQGFITKPTRDLPPNATRINKNLGERVELVGYETGARELERGKFYDVVMYWKLLQTVNYNYQVTLQLLNANGENVAQYDEIPLSEILPMTRWKLDELYREPLRVKIPQTLVPGEYRAIVKLYEPRSGEVLGAIIELGSLRVR